MSTPSFFTTSGRHGPLRLAAAGSGRFSSDLVFRGDQGWTAAVDVDQFGAAAFYELGRRLDPRRLPPLARVGIAVPIVYGPKRSHAIILVGDAINGAGWTLYGYLAGFDLPAARGVDDLLHRPLLGPRDLLYRIDRRSRRLRPTGAKGRPAAFRGPGSGCSTWHQTDGSRYIACPRSIKHAGTDGRPRTVFKQPPSGIEVTWPFLAPSPDGRALLLEEDFSSCGTHQFTDVLPLGSGVLVPLLDSREAQPLGWLPFKQWEEALVAGLSGGSEECGSAAAGIYDVFPPPQASSSSSLIVATNIGDATTW